MKLTNLRKKRLLTAQIYAVIDKKVLKDRPLFDAVRKIKKSGVDIIQLRDKASSEETVLKDAQQIRRILSGPETLFIINDYVGIARITDSDGVHLGQDDVSLKLARRILGRDKIIGVSCHNLTQARKAIKEGADYISMGPIFTTTTKPDLAPIGLKPLREIKKGMPVPVFAIGGINLDNIKKVTALGIKRIAVSSAVCRAKNINLAVKYLKQALRALR